MPFLETTRRGILGLIGGLAIFRSAGAASTDSFELVPRLAVGQAFTYRLDQTVHRNGALAMKAEAQVTQQVLDRLERGWLVRWTASKSEVRDAAPGVRPLLEAMQSAWDGVPLDVVLDTAGRVVGLADAAALQAAMAVAMDRVVDRLSKEPSHAMFAGVTRSALAPLLEQHTLLANAMLKEIRILTGAMGHAYRVGEPLTVNSSIESPFGTGQIPVLGRFSIGAVDASTQRATLKWLMVVDRPAAAQAVAAELAAMFEMPADGADENFMRFADAQSTLDFDDRGEFDIDTGTAWPVAVRHVRRMSMAEGSRVDEVRLNRMSG